MTAHALAALRNLLRRHRTSTRPTPPSQRAPRRRDFQDTQPMLFRSEGFVEDLGSAYHRP